LCEDIEILRAELTDIILEKDDLLMVECQNLRIKYSMTIGAYEYKVYQFYCDVERIKRKIELVQAKLNRNEVVFMPLIEAQLNKEYAEYEQKLEDMLKNIDEADRLSKCERMTEEESRDFKKLYRNVVKKLHPDLNPNATKREIELFQKAVDAYEHGDIEGLRMVCILAESIDEKLPAEDSSSSLDKLKKHKEELEHEIGVMRSSIERIKSEFPYNKKDILLNEEKLNAEIEELKKVLDYYRDIYEHYKKRLNQMLGDTDG
ncbi:MAG: hypothetical protein J1E41_03995, partial [Ruminococcus sp.]|nr:hypothetical protein [Ruminococcus sp.]